MHERTGRRDPGSLAAQGRTANAEPGKSSRVTTRYPLQMGRVVTPGARLPTLNPDTSLPVAMLSHLGTADPDSEFDEKLPVEVLAANALAHGMLGTPVELPHKAEIEARLGRTVDNVRCFAGPEAQEACAMVSALAFTVGNVIVLGTQSPSLEVVLHEVVHYFQQGGDQVKVSGGSPLPLASPGDASEREADAVTTDALAGRADDSEGSPQITQTNQQQLNGLFYLSGCSRTEDKAEKAPTQVSNRIADPPYGWTSKYEVTFGSSEISLRVKVKLDPQSGVSKEDVKSVGTRASAAFKTYYDQKFIFTDTADGKKYVLRCAADFVDSGEHDVVKLHAGGDASTGGHRVKWYVGWPDIDYAHELGHHLGLKDEYVDASASSRAKPTSPGVHTDHSLMGNYYSEGRDKAELKLRHGQTIAGHVGGATGRNFTVSRK